MQHEAFAMVRDGGTFVGVKPGAEPPTERGIAVGVVVARPDGRRLALLLDAAARGRLPVRVHAAVPLAAVADAHCAVAKGGVRGKFVLRP
jgi:hypothetical protein